MDVAGTHDPQDVEYWKFNRNAVEQVRVGPYGIPLIPVSPQYKSSGSTKVGIVGGRNACETVRLTMDRKPQGVAGSDDMHMTDPCEGPFYFRRVSQG